MSKLTRSAFPIVAGLSLALIGGGVAQAADSWLGAWKMNVAKSEFTPGPAPKSQESRFEAVAGGAVKLTTNTVDAQGKATQAELVTMFDGKDAEVKGTSAPTTRAYSRIDDHTFEFVEKVNGKVSRKARGTVSPDGKTRTVVSTGTNAEGKPVSSKAVFERQ